MKIGIVGFPFSGKTTLFNALTGASPIADSAGGKKEAHHAMIKVPDPRLDRLHQILGTKKKIAATIEYVDLSGISADEQKKGSFSDQFLGQLRTVDAVLVIVRAFTHELVAHPLGSIDPVRDLQLVQEEFILSDLSIIENRMHALEREMRAHKTDQDVREYHLLEKFKPTLENAQPLRGLELTADEEAIVRGYQFLTLKPHILVVNIDENDLTREAEIAQMHSHWQNIPNTTVVPISAEIEMEIGQLEPEEAAVFLQDAGLQQPAKDRLIRVSYQLLGLLSFFTWNEDEVRAWTIHRNTHASQAAGKVHSDMERGFIRAEVVHYDDFIVRGSIAKCRSDAVLRLEGKDYIVKDGDMINFRFAV
ncbi:redox-regulated ATPase YchF [candidate division KSB1 bacterium]|nr:redox-regulated ATPase YchF [candidate division KSB1 bacterium]